MIKKLDLLIIKSFIPPFIATFFITLLVLLMQFFWLYIDDFVGKGLDISIILKFMGYECAVLVSLALPLSVLLSSLMTFGNLGESFELVAIKSAGISLLRFMRPMFFMATLLSLVAFVFTNYLMPVAFLKSRTLLSDIVFAKPAFDLKEGVFYDKINGFVLKVGKKENDSLLKDIIVYEQSNSLQDNFIVAESGIMRKSSDGANLDFILKNGWRYQEKGNNAGYGTTKTDFIRMKFGEYKTQFDISSFFLNQTPDSLNRTNANMLNMKQLDVVLDSIVKDDKKQKTDLYKSLDAQMPFLQVLDSSLKIPSALQKKYAGKKLSAIIPDSMNNPIFHQTQGRVMSIQNILNTFSYSDKERGRNIRIHYSEWHKKLLFSSAVLILFLIGAPLGSIIRKGGLGTPLLAAIVFFMIFYFTSTIGAKAAQEGSMPMIVGVWLPALILVPTGIFLTVKAMNDSQLFNAEKYYKVFQFMGSLISKRKKQEKV